MCSLWLRDVNARDVRPLRVWLKAELTCRTYAHTHGKHIYTYSAFVQITQQQTHTLPYVSCISFILGQFSSRAWQTCLRRHRTNTPRPVCHYDCLQNFCLKEKSIIKYLWCVCVIRCVHLSLALNSVSMHLRATRNKLSKILNSKFKKVQIALLLATLLQPAFPNTREYIRLN